MDRYECQFASASESFDTSTPAGRLTLQLLGSFAEFERERNRERVKENMISLARGGQKIITRPCFGYDVIEGAMVVNLEEALTARKMAEMAAAGDGSRIIAKWLNSNGIRTKEGNEWHEKVVREYLQRETLIGDFVYNKTYKKNGRVLKRPEDEWIRIDNHHDAIIDDDTFQKIGQLYASRKTIGRYISEDKYLLSGLVVCGHCGGKMNGKMNRSYSKKLDQENLHYQYLCDGYLKKGNCYHHYVRRDEIEELIIRRINTVATSAPGSLQIVIAKAQNKGSSLEKEAIQTKLNKLEKRMQKQIEAYEDDLISANDLKLARKRIEEERIKLMEALNEVDKDRTESDQRRVQENAKRLLG
ncbi:recombinase family protein, partial [Mycobacterium tuberculosis]|uniref:recombinase family protein n=1 Tax=Mycobacterium tuberculosis TaxID=1773 RepID=UPI001186B75C